MIMFFLPWWTYVLVGTVSFACAFGAVWLANIAEPGVKHDEEPFPCGEHLGTDDDGAEDWCWQMAGHDGDHLGMRQEWPEDPVRVHRLEWPVPAWLNEELVSFTTMDGVTTTIEADGTLTDLPPLPQRLSKVPVQTEHNDPWPQCTTQSSEGRCCLAKSHRGPHHCI